MKVFILCGGQALRLNGEFLNIPKPLIPIHTTPLLAYIIEHYKKCKVNEIFLLVGNYEEQFQSFANNYTDEFCRITILQTGKGTPTGGRLKQIKTYLSKNEDFFLTYGDGVSNVNLDKQLLFHQQYKKIATLTAVNPILQYGLLNITNDTLITSFNEKPKLNEFISGGFFILNQQILSFLQENSDFEKDILPLLATNNELMAFKHNGYWKSLDTFKDYIEMNSDDFLKNWFND